MLRPQQPILPDNRKHHQNQPITSQTAAKRLVVVGGGGCISLGCVCVSQYAARFGQQFDYGDFGSPSGDVRALQPGGTREWIATLGSTTCVNDTL